MFFFLGFCCRLNAQYVIITACGLNKNNHYKRCSLMTIANENPGYVTRAEMFTHEKLLRLPCGSYNERQENDLE